MMNMDIERIVREKCAELGIEYDDSIASVDKGIHNKTTKYGLPTY